MTCRGWRARRSGRADRGANEIGVRLKRGWRRAGGVLPPRAGEGWGGGQIAKTCPTNPLPALRADLPASGGGAAARAIVNREHHGAGNTMVSSTRQRIATGVPGASAPCGGRDISTWMMSPGAPPCSRNSVLEPEIDHVGEHRSQIVELGLRPFAEQYRLGAYRDHHGTPRPERAGRAHRPERGGQPPQFRPPRRATVPRSRVDCPTNSSTNRLFGRP